MDDSYQLNTPEQVELSFETAGLGSRFLATLIDTIVQFVLLVALLLLIAALAWFGSLSSPNLASRLPRSVTSEQAAFAIVAIMVLLMFLAWWGYYIFFEMAWNGQTPGKRLASIRVLTTAGQPITLVHALVRNLIRIVDYLPTSYMIGMIAILATRRSQRLGDLAAGTIVVRVRREAAPRLLETPAVETLGPGQASLFGAEEVALAREFLLRREQLSPERRSELAARIAGQLRGRLGPDGAAIPAETLLASVAALRR